MYHKGEPYTLIAFGPYNDGGFDVEVHIGHVDNNTFAGSYLFTHTLTRGTHVIMDMWDVLDRELV